MPRQSARKSSGRRWKSTAPTACAISGASTSSGTAGAARCFEVDVSPGMTERSLFPMACAAAGLSLPAVLDTLVNEAYARGACF